MAHSAYSAESAESARRQSSFRSARRGNNAEKSALFSFLPRDPVDKMTQSRETRFVRTKFFFSSNSFLDFAADHVQFTVCAVVKVLWSKNKSRENCVCVFLVSLEEVVCLRVSIFCLQGRLER